jgi:hypothetical protein
MAVKGDLSGLLVLNNTIKVALGWAANPPTCHEASCKKLRDESLHNFLGLVGYCMMDIGEDLLNLCITTCPLMI